MTPRDVIGLAALLLVAGACSQSAASHPTAATADDIFSLRVLPTFEIALDDDAVASLSTSPRTWVRGSFRFGDDYRDDVAVKFKGHRSMRGWDSKPSFKLRFDKFDDAGRMLGLRRITLNNMVEDPTMLREWLGYRAYRAAGVPAPRTGYARVLVNGELFGLYAMVETVDTDFVHANYDDPSGSVYEGEYGCDMYEDDVPGFDQDAGRDRTRADLTAFARDRLDAIDRPRVLAYLAMSAVLGDFDGYRHAHNYFVYREPAAGKWTFVPWGIDRVFKQRIDLYDSEGIIAVECFRDAACRADYARELHRIADLLDGMSLDLAAMQVTKFIDPVAKRDPKRPHAWKRVQRARVDLLAFVRERTTEVRSAAACIDDTGAEVDADGDGYACLDCSDDRADVHPGAIEVCGDGIDNDCSGGIDDAPACGCPRVDIDGTAFYLCDHPMPWADAAAHCAAQGLTLARIDSAEQSRALYRAARDVRDERWWIGMTDRPVEGSYGWVDGAPATFTNWAKGEPDNDACNQDCVALKDGGDGTWHDTHCAQRRAFVCR